MKSLLAAEHISKQNTDLQFALSKTSFQIASGDRMAIVGETGAGKSTLLKLIAGLLEADTGTIRYRGELVLGPSRKLIPGHDRIGHLSQHFELPKFISVQDYLDRPYENTQEETNSIYKACQIEHLLNNETRELSGGEKQRVALAKTLLKSPEILVLDEPFSNLDTHHKKIIKVVLQNMYENLGLTMILVAHDPLDVLSWATEIMILREGRVIQKGPPKQVYENPKNEYVAGLFGSYSLVDPIRWKIDKQKQTLINAKAILRPHHFTIEGNASDSNGKVTRTNYQGSYTEVTINCEGEEIHVHSFSNNMNKGDDVKVILNKEHL